MSLLHVLVYIALLVFIIAIVFRGVKIARAPIHLRWELYPVPHEKGRAGYGGSRLEEVDWWTRSEKKNRLGELGVMIPEILLLKGVWEHNRPLWLVSWMLHFGLYLVIGLFLLQLLAGLLDHFGGVSFTAGWGAVYLWVVKLVALAGYILGLVGAFLLLIRRITDTRLKMFNNTSHYLNLVHLGAIFATGLMWMMDSGGFATQQRWLVVSLFTVQAAPALPVAAWVHIVLVLLFIVYLPFTHMTHFFTKYFTYHSVRWEDEANLPGGRLESKIKRVVSQKVSWAAPHVHSEGRKTWAELVGMTGGEKKEEAE